MIVLDGTEQRSTTPSDFNMNSYHHDRVVLPYIGELWGDLRLEVMRLIYLSERSIPDNAHYDQLVDDVLVNMSFNIQKKAVRVTAYLAITLKNGNSFSGRVPIWAGAEEVRSVLDCFFAAGGKGLDPAFLAHYAEVYGTWAAR